MAELEVAIHGEAGGVSASTFRETILYSVGLLREFDFAFSRKRHGSLGWYVSRLAVANGLVMAFTSRVKMPRRVRIKPADLSSQITHTFIDGLESIENRGITPPFLSEGGLYKVQELSSLIGKNGATGFGFSYDSQSVEVTSRTTKNVSKLLRIERIALGSVEGKLEVINLHRRPRFIVYQTVTNKAVTCLFDDKCDLELIKHSLGKNVIVSGELRKNANGDTLQVQMEALRIIGSSPAVADISGYKTPHFAELSSTEDYMRIVRG